MRSKYNYNELVKVNGIGKNFGKVENKLGFIIRKDDCYDDYYIKMIFGEEDWFGGMFWWDWGTFIYDTPEEAAKENGFDIHLKKAEKVMKDYYMSH